MSTNLSADIGLLRSSVEDFYYEEADLLDSYLLREWLDLLADDIRYRVPIRVNRSERGRSVSRLSETDMLLDEDKKGLTQRVVRLETGRAWAEEPRSRTRHLVTNVRSVPPSATARLQCHRTSSPTGIAGGRRRFYVGRREDVLRVVSGSLKVASRLVMLDQAVLTAKNMTILF